MDEDEEEAEEGGSKAPFGAVGSPMWTLPLYSLLNTEKQA